MFASAIDKVDTWSELANSGLYHLDIELGNVFYNGRISSISSNYISTLAIRSFQQTKNAAMVASLQEIQVMNYTCTCTCRVLSTGEGGGEASTPNTISSPQKTK